jgi:TrmH family RNA methyltransferase
MTNQARDISSPSNPTVKRLKSLLLRKHREEEGLFLVEGQRHIEEALQAGFRLSILLYDDDLAPHWALAHHGAEVGTNDTIATPPPKTLVLSTTREILQRLTNRENAQPYLAAFQIPSFGLEHVKNNVWVGLDSIRDPGNLGTILRTADAAGIAGLILIGSCCDPYQLETIRATMGSFARIPVIRASYDEFSDFAKGYKAPLIGTHLHEKARDYREIPYPSDMIILMGNESNGLSHTMANLCHDFAIIPMVGGTESLNLSVATSLMMYEIRRPHLPAH